MQKKEFIRQLNELVPRPDPVTTEALYRFDRECAESEYIDMLTALRVVARNFSGETLQGAYELIQHQNAALPSEMFAAAVCLQAGRTPAEGVTAGGEGRPHGLFRARAAGGAQPDCSLHGIRGGPGAVVLHHGLWDGSTRRHALKRAITYGRKAGISTTQAMACLTTDQPGFVKRAGGPPLYPARHELGAHRGLVSRSSRTAPPWAAHITCNADLGIAEVACHPLWLERNQSQTSMARCEKTAGYYGHSVVCCVLTKRGERGYERSEKTGHVQKPR